jgi:hypothetical protein
MDAQTEHLVSRHALLNLLWTSLRALIPSLLFDVGGTMLVYYLLLPHFGATSLWPVLGASLVPSVSNIYNGVKRRTVDIIGLIVLIGIVAGLLPAAFGGSQRLLLVRESFVTGAIGAGLLVSLALHRPAAYYVIREFLTANETLPRERFTMLWKSWTFRNAVRGMTLGWGVLLLCECALRIFMAFRMNIAFVLGAAPVLFTILLLLAGAATAFWLAHAMKAALNHLTA